MVLTIKEYNLLFNMAVKIQFNFAQREIVKVMGLF